MSLSSELMVMMHSWMHFTLPTSGMHTYLPHSYGPCLEPGLEPLHAALALATLRL